MDGLLERKAAEYGIPPDLLRAVVHVESGGNPWAMRYEDHWRWFTDLDKYSGSYQSLDTEKQAQKTSWGLMQIMGGTARGMGFDGRFLSELLDPETNLTWGCMYLRNQYLRYGCWEDAVAAYNAGSVRKRENGTYYNQGYVDKVFDYIKNQ